MKNIIGNNRGYVLVLAGASALAIMGCYDFDAAYERYCETHDCPCTNGQTHACYTGPEGTKGVGICKEGIQTCVDNKFSECAGEVKPQETDLCDGKDENCDGNTNTGCDCSTNQTKTCNPGFCNQEQITCSDGKFSCPEPVKLETEAEFCSRLGKNCDVVTAVDNNCKTLRSVNCGKCVLPQLCSSNVCGGCSTPNAPKDQANPLPTISTFTATNDVVVDSVTGLVWQRNVGGYHCDAPYWYTGCNLPQGVDYCSKLSLAGCDKWRVPTKTELASLFFNTKDYPDTNADAFPQMKGSVYYTNFWTSTCDDNECINTHGSTGVALEMAVGVGFQPANLNNNYLTIRCVR